MKGIIIREAGISDISQIVMLQRIWHKERNIHGYRPDSKKNLVKALGPYFLVAEKDIRIIGFVYGHVNKSKGLAVIPKGKKYLEINDIYVKKGFRSSGIGGKMLDRILSISKENGVNRFLIYSAAKDLDKIVKFYRKHGFKTWYVQMYK